jgi:protein tyrosine phosphatase (PTP) superfamily phosphohydrolase (DUF442 family)
MPWRSLAAVAIVASVLGGTTISIFWINRRAWFWDHFDVVQPGVLYRSGRLGPTQLEAAQRRYGIRTVVSFLRPGRDTELERERCKRLGMDWINLPMSGDGFGQEEQFRKVLAVLDQPERLPVLVHCASGTCRTGTAVALYRYEHDGWTIEDVADEMKRHVYRSGWIPGYAYAMVRDRPFAEIYTPLLTEDRNLPATEERTDDVD